MTETNVQAKDKLYIAGRWVSASGNGRTEMVSPSSEQPVYSVPEATEAEVDAAVRDFDFDAPYGGFKSSGTERELGGIEGILGFTEARAIGL